MVEHSTADREVPGSNPNAPLKIILANKKLNIRKIDIYDFGCDLKDSPLGGLEPPTLRLTAERASRLRHRGFLSLLTGLNIFSFYYLC